MFERGVFVRATHIYRGALPRLRLIKMTRGGVGELIKIASTVIKADRGEQELFLWYCW